MERVLTGGQRKKIFTEMLGARSAGSFLKETTGFLARLNFSANPAGEFQLSVFDTARPDDHCVVRVSRATGEIVAAFNSDSKGNIDFSITSATPLEERHSAELESDSLLMRFAEARAHNPPPAAQKSGRTSLGRPR